MFPSLLKAAPPSDPNAGLSSRFARRVLGAREAKRLESILVTAEKQARARLDQAHRESEEIYAHARAEAEAILAALPNFYAIEALPATKGKSAFRAIRAAADRHGLPLAVVIGTVQHPKAHAARAEAVIALADACPRLTDDDIGQLLSLSATAVRRIRFAGRAA